MVKNESYTPCIYCIFNIFSLVFEAMQPGSIHIQHAYNIV